MSLHRLFAKTTSTRSFTSLPRATGRTMNPSVATSLPSLFLWPLFSLVSQHHFTLTHIRYTQVVVFLRQSSKCTFVVSRESERHRSNHLQFLPGILRAHQFLLLSRIVCQVSRWVTAVAYRSQPCLDNETSDYSNDDHAIHFYHDVH